MGGEETRTPAEIRRHSDQAHLLAGSGIALTGAAALWQELGGEQGFPLWAAVPGAGALGMLGLELTAHGGPRKYLSETMNRQHAAMFALFGTGGLSELVASLTDRSLLKFGWPATIGAVGWMFVRHEQHGTPEALEIIKRRHRRFGLTLMTAGVSRAFARMTGWRSLDIASAALVLARGAQFMLYREPEGAFEGE